MDHDDSAGPITEYYYLGAQTVGDISNTGPSQTDYASAINRQYQAASASAAANFDQNYTAIARCRPVTARPPTRCKRATPCSRSPRTSGATPTSGT